MSGLSGQFERIAEAVTERTAALLGSRVSVIDDRGATIASSRPAQGEPPLDPDAPPRQDDYVRVPLRLAGRGGEVLVAEPLTGEGISPRLAQVLVELVINQTAVVDRLPNQHELKNKFIHDLLHNAIDDEAAILREGQVLGMDFAPPRAVILIDAADYILAPVGSSRREATDTVIWRRAQVVIGSVVNFFRLPSDTICAHIGHGEVAVLKASNTKNLESWVEQADEHDPTSPSWANLTALKRAGNALLTRLRSDTRASINMGLGRYHPGVRGLAHSYQDARAALSLGRRFHGQDGVYCLDALGIAAFVGLSDERTKIELATYLLSPLDHEPELLDTLGAFFAADCSPSATAQRLAIHRNTLAYRLDKITSLTGFDPRHFDDAVQIRLALVLRSLNTTRD